MAPETDIEGDLERYLPKHLSAPPSSPTIDVFGGAVRPERCRACAVARADAVRGRGVFWVCGGGAMRRLRGSRRLLLCFLVPVTVGLFGFVPLGVLVLSWVDFAERSPAAPWWAVVWLIPLLYCIARAPFVGIWLGDSSVKVRSWFTSRVIDRQEVVGCRSVGYVGLFSFTAYPAGSGRFNPAIVVIETRTEEVRLRGTIGPRATTRCQVRELLQWAGTNADSVRP